MNFMLVDGSNKQSTFIVKEGVQILSETAGCTISSIKLRVSKRNL